MGVKAGLGLDWILLLIKCRNVGKADDELGNIQYVCGSRKARKSTYGKCSRYYLFGALERERSVKFECWFWIRAMHGKTSFRIVDFFNGFL